MSEKTLLSQRLTELANRSYNNNQYTFTNFLSVQELSEFYGMERELSFAGITVYGGCDIAERQMVRFGSEASLGYVEDFPIAAILIKPLSSKFSDDLNHRDFLGALMNLGIKRETLGDIFVKGNEACLFCIDSMAEYITENLTRIKHTTVIATVVEDVSNITEPTLEDKLIQVNSERIDAVIAKVYNLSRGDALDLFPKNLVFLNGRLCTENAKNLKAEDKVSVRGFGKFIFSNVAGVSKKGKTNCLIKIYK